MEQPLVSVIVVCYNASEYIIETLESVKAQTYKNLELIVSDDCSRDGTADIARAWMNDNKNLFVRTELITVDHNTGVSANYNRAVKACQGEWIKNVDGDDLIAPNCVEENIEYVVKHPDAKLIFSNMYFFRGNNIKDIVKEYVPGAGTNFFELDVEGQFKFIVGDNILPSQTMFVKKELLDQHPYNEKYIALEDSPMWATLTRNGHRVYHLDSYTAYYRIDESMTSSNSRFYSPIYTESVFMYFWGEKIQYIRKYKLEEAYNNNRRILLLFDIAFALFKNKKTRITNFLFKIISKFIYKYVHYSL